MGSTSPQIMSAAPVATCPRPLRPRRLHLGADHDFMITRPSVSRVAFVRMSTHGWFCVRLRRAYGSPAPEPPEQAPESLESPATTGEASSVLLGLPP